MRGLISILFLFAVGVQAQEVWPQRFLRVDGTRHSVVVLHLDGTAAFSTRRPREGANDYYFVATKASWLAGLEFEAGPVRVIVHEGISFSGYRDIPIRMRASYSRSTKQATLVHELAHRLISDLVPGTFEDHPIIFLFVYDVWVELWGREFANREVEVESARRGPSDYRGTWQSVLALSADERAQKFQQFLREPPGR